MTETYQRIEELCRNKGVTVTALCKICQIPRASLSDYKMGRIKTLSAKSLSKIAEYFSVSVEYLMYGETVAIDEHSLKIALFGGGTEVTEEMLNEVKRYAQYVKEREYGNGKTI